MLLNLILLIIFIIIIKYYINKNKINIDDEKIKFLNANIDYRIHNEKRIFDLVFCPEYKYYNPEAYHEIIDYLNAFLEIYEIIKIDPSRSSDLYQNMLDNKKYIINSLISMSIRLPIEYNIKKYTDEMDEALQYYLIEVNKIHEEYLRENGFDCTTKLIFLNHPDGYNLDDNIIEPGKKLLFNRV